MAQLGLSLVPELEPELGYGFYAKIGPVQPVVMFKQLIHVQAVLIEPLEPHRVGAKKMLAGMRNELLLNQRQEDVIPATVDVYVQKDRA